LTYKNTDMTKNVEYKARILRPMDVGDSLVSAWADLESRATVSNAYLSPYFVLPASKYLEASSAAFGVFAEKMHGGSSTLIGVAFFKINKPTRHFPLYHLAAFESIHSYLAGFLLDKEYTNEALRAICETLIKEVKPWHGLYINNGSPEDFLTEESKRILADSGMVWTSLSQWERGTLYRSGEDGSFPLLISKNQRKNYRRALRNLNELGHLEWREIREEKLLSNCADEFMRLEHMGWKGSKGTSLYSDPKHVGFFREMIAGFGRENRAFFTELSLDGNVIASTSNLISGNAGFAFKVGWDINFARFAPGIVNEIQMLEHQKDVFNGLDIVDSSAAPDSYINNLWPGRRTITEGIFTHTRMGQIALAGVQKVKKIKNALRSGAPSLSRVEETS
jgi:hypothetical protein